MKLTYKNPFCKENKLRTKLITSHQNMPDVEVLLINRFEIFACAYLAFILNI